MKIAIIGLMAILLVGAGAGGAYFFFDKPAEASAGPVDEAAKAEHEAKVKGAEGEAVAPQEVFVQLAPMIFPIIDEKGVSQTVSLVVSIEVPDALTAAEVDRLSPRLKDAYIQDMYGQLNRKTSMENGVIQVAKIKDRLHKISVKVLGEDVINDVLLQVVQQRRV